MDGLPVLLTKTEIEASTPTISLTSGDNPVPHPIQLRDPCDAHKTLGIYLAPTGNDSAQALHMQQLSNRFAASIASSNLSRVESLLAYKTTWFSSVSYSLGTTCLSNQ